MRTPMLAALTLAIGSVVSCAPADSSTSEEVVLRMIEAINTRNFDALDEVVSPAVRRYSGATPEVQVGNLDEFKAFLHADLASVPDAMQEINQMFSSGDMVALHATYTGTQTGPMGPFPPSGKQLELPFIGLLRVESGKIAEIWVEWDNLNALAQLGHFPPPGMIPEEEAPSVE
jgi:steroid delta-isomerase-like uncharacterized protein